MVWNKEQHVHATAGYGAAADVPHHQQYICVESGLYKVIYRPEARKCLWTVETHTQLELKMLNAIGQLRVAVHVLPHNPETSMALIIG